MSLSIDGFIDPGDNIQFNGRDPASKTEWAITENNVLYRYNPLNRWLEIKTISRDDKFNIEINEASLEIDDQLGGKFKLFYNDPSAILIAIKNHSMVKTIDENTSKIKDEKTVLCEISKDANRVHKVSILWRIILASLVLVTLNIVHYYVFVQSGYTSWLPLLIVSLFPLPVFMIAYYRSYLSRFFGDATLLLNKGKIQTSFNSGKADTIDLKDTTRIKIGIIPHDKGVVALEMRIKFTKKVLKWKRILLPPLSIDMIRSIIVPEIIRASAERILSRIKDKPAIIVKNFLPLNIILVSAVPMFIFMVTMFAFVCIWIGVGWIYLVFLSANEYDFFDVLRARVKSKYSSGVG